MNSNIPIINWKVSQKRFQWKSTANDRASAIDDIDKYEIKI
jgi:hypothetical protein